jgi:hypothetical protein
MDEKNRLANFRISFFFGRCKNSHRHTRRQHTDTTAAAANSIFICLRETEKNKQKKQNWVTIIIFLYVCV